MLKRIILAAAAAGTLLAVAVPVAQAAPAPKRDTPACGTTCQSVFSAELGSNVTMNAFAPGDNGISGKTGTRVNLHLFGNFRPNGDFEANFVGQVFQFCGFFANDFFSPTSVACTHYPFFDVIEVDWAPFGQESGLCAGVASAVNGANVTLQPCGTKATTVWIADRAHATLGTDCRNPVPFLPVGPGIDPSVNYCPWINGGDTSFSHPLVLSLNTGSKNPGNQLKLATENLVGGLIRSNEAWAYYFG